MKKMLIHLFSMTLLLCCTAKTYAHTEKAPCSDCKAHTSEKVYIHPDQLGITAEGIFVHHNNQWMQTKGVFSDEGGIYFQSPILSEDGCRKNFFPCRNCGRCVKYFYDICPQCGKPT